MQIRLDIPNLHVMMVLQSLRSRGYVTEKLNWQLYYYFLTNEGIDYLKEVLHLPLMMVLQSLCSRGYVTEKFNWQWYYYFLTLRTTVFINNVLSGP